MDRIFCVFNPANGPKTVLDHETKFVVFGGILDTRNGLSELGGDDLLEKIPRVKPVGHGPAGAPGLVPVFRRTRDGGIVRVVVAILVRTLQAISLLLDLPRVDDEPGGGVVEDGIPAGGDAARDRRRPLIDSLAFCLADSLPFMLTLRVHRSLSAILEIPYFSTLFPQFYFALFFSLQLPSHRIVTDYSGSRLLFRPTIVHRSSLTNDDKSRQRCGQHFSKKKIFFK